ncbi:Dual specificity phosphatase catalytic domain [Phytophthora infestans]|uniref:Dual specificity phosphatase catalytic domain n=1 Tax=Phytophthora infestans TaxID=4787 RepID=A0A833TBQ3_PHYIN|nr:Dual specificity phosphatase catalytic domain [Phytophthora infestans]
MGNGQSRDGFEGVLPSASGATTANTDPPIISDAWSAASSAEDGSVRPVVNISPVHIDKIVPPGHALQHEDTPRLSPEASEVVRAFNNVERAEDRFAVPESVRKSRALDAYVDVCSEILPGFLYVSNLRVARDTAKLRALGITHVINCCGELKHFANGVEQHEATAFTVLKLSLRDDATEDLTPFFPRVVQQIANSRQQSQNGTIEKVLVHCHQGVSRSCAFAIAYVMLEQQLPYREAAVIVKRQRAISSPNSAFICQLLEWEKDLHLMRTSGNTAFGGLYRLAPHAIYDPECLVLKRCYDPSAGSARQRQNVAIVRTPDDEQRLLWSQGTFVYQSPTSVSGLVIWHGSKCEIPVAVVNATELAQELVCMQQLAQNSEATTQLRIVEVQESSEGHRGSDFDLFGYATELQWSRDLIPKVPQFLLATNERNSNATDRLGTEPASSVSVPKLFVLEEIGEQSGDGLWGRLTNYDSEDLTPDNSFLLCSIKPHEAVQGYVWVGSTCSLAPDKVVQAAQKQIQSLSETNSLPSLVIEHQDQESDAFWELFEAGY